MKPRLRFAPSPTGYLHIGGARTALFNWLYARHHGGTFVLRIEDTDQERSTRASVDAILEGLKWLGLDWDEGPDVGGPYPPYTQTAKLPRYREIAEELIHRGLAYRDYTTEEELVEKRAAFARARGLKEGDDLRTAGFKYTSPYRDQAVVKDAPHVIRFRHDARAQRLSFDDLVLGALHKPEEDLDDFVLVRTDGIPLYNFGCVVDDHDMAITVVARGQEHVNSTFPQLVLYRALGWEPPRFAHFPLIMGASREKLSKRKHPEADVMIHRKNGILPEALVNFVARLGWSHGNEEIFTRDRLVELFDFDHVGSSNGVWNPDKLLALNQHWMRETPAPALAEQLVPFLAEEGVTGVAPARLVAAVTAFAPRCRTLKEMAQLSRGYFVHGVAVDAQARAKHLDAAGKDMVRRAAELLATQEDWSPAALDPIVDTLAQATGAKKGQVAQPIRVAVTGGTTSPGIGDTLALVGRDEALFRLRAAMES